MHRLLYISTAREPVTDDTISQILQVSRRNNERDGITGLLVVGRRRYLQVLEGDERTVAETFDRIAADPRHHSCVLLGKRQADRQFSRWSMGVVRSDEGYSVGQNCTLANLISSIADPLLRADLEGFVAYHIGEEDRAA